MTYSSKTLTLAAISILGSTAVHSQITASAYMGYDQSQINDFGLINPIDAFQTGTSANNDILINGSSNVFTLTFDDGETLGSATFSVTDSISTPELRQFASGLQGPDNSAESISVTLDSTTNLDSILLTRIPTTGNANGVLEFTAMLPDSTSTTNNIVSSTWLVGQTLTLSSNEAATDGKRYQAVGFEVVGSISAIPEVSHFSAILAAIAMSTLVIRRRK